MRPRLKPKRVISTLSRTMTAKSFTPTPARMAKSRNTATMTLQTSKPPRNILTNSSMKKRESKATKRNQSAKAKASADCIERYGQNAQRRIKVKKSLLIIVALLLAALPITAQNRTSFAGVRNAYDYSYGFQQSTPGLVIDLPTSPSTAGASTTFTVSSAATTAPDGRVFYPLAVSAPIYIVDAGGVD